MTKKTTTYTFVKEDRVRPIGKPVEFDPPAKLYIGDKVAEIDENLVKPASKPKTSK